MNRLTNDGTLKGEAAMSTANPEQSRKVIAKILVTAAIAVGFGVVGAAPASADPNPAGTDPNPFGTLGCSCRDSAPAGSPQARDDIDRGIREGLTASLPGLPPPAQPSQPRR
jgi:hypothetical protein